MIDVNDRGTLTALTFAAVALWPITLVVALGWLAVETIRVHTQEDTE